MLSVSKISLIIVVVTVFSITSIPNSFGHGIGYEVLPPVMMGDKQVSLEVISSTYEDPESSDREIMFSLFDTETSITIKEVTYSIEATKGGNFLFADTFEAGDGILIMNLLQSDSDEVTIKQEDQANFFESLIGDQKNVVEISGSPFNTGGLYKFKVEVLTAESFSNILDEPIFYDVGLSIPQKTFYNIVDPNFGEQELGVITYYDEIQDFNYDSSSREVTFRMPFEWDLNSINQTSVVHEELLFSKSFGDLMVYDFSVSVNGYELPENVASVDDFYNDVQRIVHVVIINDYLIDLYENVEDKNNEMRFLIKPKAENLPLSTLTNNGQFRINLDWEPNEIKSGSKTTFSFDVMDIFLKNKPVSTNYDFSIIYEEEVLYSQSGISTDVVGERNVVEFVIPENVSGPVTLQFSNLDGNSIASASLPVVVDRKGVESQSDVSIPNWVRNNAGWWSAGEIDDQAFASGIEYMIKESIIRVPPTSSEESSQDPVIPDWVRNNAGWWSAGEIDDNAFAGGIQYLIENRIISV